MHSNAGPPLIAFIQQSAFLHSTSCQITNQSPRESDRLSNRRSDNVHGFPWPCGLAGKPCVPIRAVDLVGGSNSSHWCARYSDQPPVAWKWCAPFDRSADWRPTLIRQSAHSGFWTRFALILRIVLHLMVQKTTHPCTGSLSKFAYKRGGTTPLVSLSPLVR